VNAAPAAGVAPLRDRPREGSSGEQCGEATAAHRGRGYELKGADGELAASAAPETRRARVLDVPALSDD
jgi:hypothetical protein